MPALLLGRELILEVHGSGARLDHRLHQLEGVQRPAEPGLGVGDDRREPVRRVVPFRVRDLIGPQERVVDALHQRGRAARGIQALIGVRVTGEVCIRRHLPAGEVDRLQPGLDHLHRLATGHRSQCRHPALLRQQPA